MKTIRYVFCFIMFALGCACFAQEQSPATQPQSAQTQAAPAHQHEEPLNATVSDFGTSFIFAPEPICSGCVEGELGFMSANGGRMMPVVITAAPFKSHTDFSVLVNALDSEMMDGRRVTQLGNRYDFVVRQHIFQKGGFILNLAPRGTVFSRDVNGGRVGGALATQYSKGENMGVLNVSYTSAVGSSPLNPKNDVQTSFDYSRMLTAKGYALTVGVQHERMTDSMQTVGTEVGFTIPFRNGQIELATQQMNLNTGHPFWQFQARIIKVQKLFKK